MISRPWPKDVFHGEHIVWGWPPSLRTKFLIACSLDRVCAKEFGWLETPASILDVGNPERIPDHVRVLKDIDHVIDWLFAADLNDAKWLASVDECGRPKKLMKCTSLAALAKEADKAMIRMSRDIRRMTLDAGHETVEMHLDGGWSVVRMLTPEALDNESAAMQHCIGLGSYDQELGKDGVEFFSLRDPGGKPHATIHVVDGGLEQFVGKQNAAPLDRYVMTLLPFVTARKFRCLYVRNLVTDVNGDTFYVTDMPEVLDTDGNVVLDCGSRQDLRLPRVIRARGYVSLSGKARFANVPDLVETEKDLVVKGNALVTLPEKVVVGNSLQVSGTDIERLPADMHVALHVEIDNTLVSRLPDDLTVNGDLMMGGTRVSELPAGLVVHGKLDISRTAVLKLPDDLRCCGIDISNTGLGEFDTTHFMPDGMFATPSLKAAGSRLESIVGEPRFGFLDISGTPFVVLPENLNVVRDLNIADTRTKSESRLDRPHRAGFGNSLPTS